MAGPLFHPARQSFTTISTYGDGGAVVKDGGNGACRRVPAIGLAPDLAGVNDLAGIASTLEQRLLTRGAPGSGQLTCTQRHGLMVSLGQAQVRSAAEHMNGTMGE